MPRSALLLLGTVGRLATSCPSRTKLTGDAAWDSMVTELPGGADDMLKDDNRLQELLPLAVAEVVIKEQRKGTSAAQL